MSCSTLTGSGSFDQDRWHVRRITELPEFVSKTAKRAKKQIAKQDLLKEGVEGLREWRRSTGFKPPPPRQICAGVGAGGGEVASRFPYARWL